MSIRDRAGYFAFWVFMVTVPFGAYFALSIGGGGATGGAAFEGHPNNPNVFRKAAVFFAAPLRLIEMGSEMLAFSKRYSPPPYSNVEFWKTQFRHKVPSNSKVTPIKRGAVEFGTYRLEWRDYGRKIIPMENRRPFGGFLPGCRSLVSDQRRG